ncbi:hypothetical protein FRC01_008011, partial [Tulasnella sp. 417]
QSSSISNINQGPQHPRRPNVVYLGLPSTTSPHKSKSAKDSACYFSPPCGPDFFSGLSAELTLNILEHLDAEDIITLRTASAKVLRVLEAGDHSSRLWKRVKLEAGVPVKKEHQVKEGHPVKDGHPVKEGRRVEERHERPDPDELVAIRYVLENHCMKCRGYPAYRQWEFGFRLCSTCLVPRITTFKDFMTEHGDMFTDWGSVPGLVGVGAPLVTRKSWANQVARDLRINITVRRPKQLKKEKAAISARIMDYLEASRGFSMSLLPLRPTNISGGEALDRLARQRQKWFTAQLLAMPSQKFIPADIPNLQNLEWSRIMSKQSEPGQEMEWNERQTRLRLMAGTRRNNRLSGLLRDHPPPLPCADSIGPPRTDQDISYRYVGSVPAVVFLKICRFSDVKTAMAIERTCSAAYSILRSSAAETTWHALRLAAGLEA